MRTLDVATALGLAWAWLPPPTACACTISPARKLAYMMSRRTCTGPVPVSSRLIAHLRHLPTPLPLPIVETQGKKKLRLSEY